MAIVQMSPPIAYRLHVANITSFEGLVIVIILQ